MRYRVPDRLNRNTRNLILEVAEKGRSIPGFISLAMGNPAEEAIPVDLICTCVKEVMAEDPWGCCNTAPCPATRR